MVTCTVEFVMHAAKVAANERQQLAQARAGRGTNPAARTPASMVDFLVERIAPPGCPEGRRPQYTPKTALTWSNTQVKV
jgi:hypothetical protein